MACEHGHEQLHNETKKVDLNTTESRKTQHKVTEEAASNVFSSVEAASSGTKAARFSPH